MNKMWWMRSLQTDKLDVVQRRVDLMAAEGVRFVVNAAVGQNVDGKELVAANDAVLMAVGATQPRDLQAEGRDFSGAWRCSGLHCSFYRVYVRCVGQQLQRLGLVLSPSIF